MQIFENRRDLFIFISIAALIVAIKLSYNYYKYTEFLKKPFVYRYAKVLKQTKKVKGSLLTLASSDGLKIYGMSYKKSLEDISKVRIMLYVPKDLSFSRYMSGFFAKFRLKKIIRTDRSLRKRLSKKIYKIHKDPKISQLYSALYLATPISKELRESISAWGINHLVALSGMHLGILWAVTYGILLIPYRYLQHRLFPYRYSLVDVGAVSLLIAFVYLIGVGSPASLVRSFAMMLLGWMVVVSGMSILSFSLLVVSVCLLLILNVSFLFSISFWLSVAGVFYIFLILKYTPPSQKKIFTYLILPFGIYIFMVPITHSIFTQTSYLQLSSPILSSAFTLFYPISILSHLLGFAELFDPLLHLLIEHGQGVVKTILLPKWLLLVYICISLLAVRYKMAFYTTAAVALFTNIYLLLK